MCSHLFYFSRIKPGSSLVKLKRDLEDKMTDQRTLEWTKRLEEEAIKKKEANDNLSDCEDMLEEFETCQNDDEDEDKKNDQKDSDSDAESEPEENDVLITDEKKDKCGFADEEAEVEDDEDAGSGDENEDEDSSSEDSGDELGQTPLEGKKTLTRIIKPDDSDSSDDENGKKELDSMQNGKLDCSEESANIVVLSTPLKKDRILKPTQSEDLFESQETSKNDTNFSLDCKFFFSHSLTFIHRLILLLHGFAYATLFVDLFLLLFDLFETFRGGRVTSRPEAVAPECDPLVDEEDLRQFLQRARH